MQRWAVLQHKVVNTKKLFSDFSSFISFFLFCIFYKYKRRYVLCIGEVRLWEFSAEKRQVLYLYWTNRRASLCLLFLLIFSRFFFKFFGERQKGIEIDQYAKNRRMNWVFVGFWNFRRFLRADAISVNISLGNLRGEYIYKYKYKFETAYMKIFILV